MLTHHEEAADDELWPRKNVDPEMREWMQAQGIRIATRSLDRPRYVAKGRPAWLAFILRTADRVDATVRRLLRKPPRGADEIDDLGDIWLFRTADDRPQPHGRAEELGAADEHWPRKDVDPEFDEEMRALGFRVPTRSLDRPRVVVKPRPAWLAFLITLIFGPAKD